LGGTLSWMWMWRLRSRLRVMEGDDLRVVVVVVYE